MSSKSMSGARPSETSSRSTSRSVLSPIGNSGGAPIAAITWAAGLDYEPGDSFGIFPLNDGRPAEAVSRLKIESSRRNIELGVVGCLLISVAGEFFAKEMRGFGRIIARLTRPG